MSLRFPSAGLAHGAADDLTETTGRPHGIIFKPRARRDTHPFVVVEERSSTFTPSDVRDAQRAELRQTYSKDERG